MDRLKLIEETLEPPLGEEICVKVRYIGLNFADIFAIFGLYSATPKGSFIPGLEYSGDVVTVGKEVKHFKPGDKVMGVTRFGGYSDRLNIDENYVSHLPDGWTYDEGAAFIIQAFTAYYALVVLGDIKEGQTGSLMFAGGVSSDSDIIGQVILEQRNFDITDWPESFGEFITGNAFKGAGQTLAVRLEPDAAMGRILAAEAVQVFFEVFGQVAGDLAELELGASQTQAEKARRLSDAEARGEQAADHVDVELGGVHLKGEDPDSLQVDLSFSETG